MAAIFAAAMLVSATALLTSCKSTAAADASSADSTAAAVILTEDTGAASTTAAAATAPEVLPGVAAGTMTINGKTVSEAEYDFYYYNIYLNYAQYAAYGAVPTVAADGSFDLSAACSMPGYEDTTWGAYIKESAQKQLQDSYILADYAQKAGMTLSEANQASIDDFYASVQSTADTYGITFDEYLTSMFGAKATKAELEPVIERYFLAGDYRTSLEATYTFTDEELQAFYTENADSYENIDLPTVRHILYMAPVGVEGYTDATEAELADAKALADAALAKVTTYDDMVSVGDAALADGSATESAEYSVGNGEMVTAFEDWCYDAARKAGDTGIIQTEYGYHVMYFVETKKDWMADAVSSLTLDAIEAYLVEQEALPQYALTAN